jgi:hypothetical protein
MRQAAGKSERRRDLACQERAPQVVVTEQSLDLSLQRLQAKPAFASPSDRMERAVRQSRARRTTSLKFELSCTRCFKMPAGTFGCHPSRCMLYAVRATLSVCTNCFSKSASILSEGVKPTFAR